MRIMATDQEACELVNTVFRQLSQDGREGISLIREIVIIPLSFEGKELSPAMFVDNKSSSCVEIPTSYVKSDSMTYEELKERLYLKLRAAGIILAEIAKGNHPITGFYKAEQTLGDLGKKAIIGFPVSYPGIDSEIPNE